MIRILFSVVAVTVPLAAGGETGPLLEATVMDADTGLPLRSFRFLPGTPYRGSRQESDSVAVWQPHLIKEGQDGKFEWSRQRTYKEFRLRIEADGYQSAETQWFKRDELTDTRTTIRIELKPDPGIEGRLLTPTGEAASGATIGIAMPNRRITLENGKIKDVDRNPPLKLSDRWRRPVIVRTNELGEFRLPTETSVAVLLAFVHESGYLQLPASQLRGPVDLKLEPWGTIEGRVLWKDKVGDGESISLIISREHVYPEMVFLSLQTVSNERGRFRFAKLPPGHAQLSRHLKESETDGGQRDYMFPVMHVDVQPGEPTRITFGGPGKTIRGTLTGLDSYAGLSVALAPQTPRMFGFVGQGENPVWAGFSAFRKSSIAPLFFREKIAVGKDGTFQFQNVIPENYQLFVSNEDNSVYKVHRLRVRSDADEAEQPVEIPLVQQRLSKP